MVKKGAKEPPRWQPLPEGASTMQVAVVPEVDEYKFNFDDATREELKNLTVFIDESNKTLEVENMIIERYLNRMDASALDKMDQIMEAATIATQKTDKAAVSLESAQSGASINRDLISRMTNNSSDESRSPTIHSDSSRAVKLAYLTLPDKGPKIQFAQKIEIVNREIDELRSALENSRKKSKKSNYLLRCRNEELSVRLQEVNDAQNYFENKFLLQGVDPITGKLPGEKFLRYLETRLRMEEMEIDRMRIRTGALKIQLKKVLQQLARKEELGETLRAVDFEQLQIENRECQEILDMKTAQLHRMKSINGSYGTHLNLQKKKLEEQEHVLSELKQRIVSKDQIIKKFTDDEEKVNSEVQVVARALEKITKLMKSYTVPDVMEYILKKAEVNELKKEVKVRTRKINVEQLIVEGQAQKLRNLGVTSSKNVLSGYSMSRVFF